MCLHFRISSEILILNGKQSSIQPHLLSSSLKGCKDEETSIRFIHQYLCALCVWRVSVSTVSKTHFPLSSVLFSHILLCSGRRRPFNSDIRQQARAKPQRSVTSGRGTISYNHTPTLFLLLPFLLRLLLSLLIRCACHIKGKSHIIKKRLQWDPASSSSPRSSQPLWGRWEREWRWSHRHQTLHT